MNAADISAGLRSSIGKLAPVWLVGMALGTFLAVVQGSLWALLALFVALTLLGTALRAPHYGLYVAVAAMPLEVAGRVVQGVPELTYAKVLLAIVIIAVLARAIVLRGAIDWPPGYWKLLLFFLVVVSASFISALSAARPGVIGSLVTYAGLVALVWLMWQLLTTERRIRALIAWIVIGSVPVSIVALLDVALGRSVLGTVDNLYYASPLQGVVRATSTFYDPNALGRYLVFAVAVTGAAGAARWFGKYRYALVAVLCLQVVALGATFSRGAIVGLLIMVLAVVIWSMRHNWKHVIGTLTLVGVIAILALRIPEASAIMHRVTAADDVVGGRPLIFKDGVQAFASSPILGYGPGFVADAIGVIRGVPTSPHNLFLEALLAVGLLGTIPLVSYAVVAGRAALARCKGDSAAGLLIVAVWSGILGVGLSLHGLKAVELWISLGLMYPIARCLGADSCGPDGEPQ